MAAKWDSWENTVPVRASGREPTRYATHCEEVEEEDAEDGESELDSGFTGDAEYSSWEDQGGSEVECQWDGIPVPAVEDDSCGQGLLIECFAKLIDGGSMEGTAIQTLENLESISEAAVLTQLLEDLDDQCNFTRYGYEERCDDLRKR